VWTIAGEPELDWSVAVSGNTLAVASPENWFGTGAVEVYQLALTDRDALQN
jgi:hypothetical protein